MPDVPAIDIRPDHWRIVNDILHKHVPQYDVWAFGSRAKWTAKEYSDLDLAVVTDKPLPLSVSASLADDFSESDLPWKVDVVDWATTSESFRKIIERDKVLAQERCVPLDRRTLPLGECLEALLDYRGKTPKKAPEGIPLVTAKIVKFGRIGSPEEFIADSDYASWMTRGFPQVGDVVLTTEAPLGEVGQIEFLPVALAQRLVVLRGKKGVLNNDYLLYLLQTEELQSQLIGRASGTTVVGIKQSELRKIELCLPPVDEQRAASRVLKAIDDRIDTLRQINATLEPIAAGLFKSWFVDFDGVAPQDMQESEVGVVPKGWNAEEMGNVVRCVGGSTPSTADRLFWDRGVHHWATPKDLSNLASPILTTTERRITDAGLARISSGLLPKGTLLMSSRAPIGYLAIAGVPTAINQGFIGIPPGGELSPQWLLFWAKANMELIKQKGNGSTFMEINKAAFRSIKVAVPPRALLAEFDGVATPLLEKIKSNEYQLAALSKLRDVLLPRLISGELRVPQ